MRHAKVISILGFMFIAAFSRHSSAQERLNFAYISPNAGSSSVLWIAKDAGIYYGLRSHYLVAQPTIKSIEDLKGKIGANHTVATSADFAIRLGLKHIGLDPDKDVSLRVVGATNLRLIMM